MNGLNGQNGAPPSQWTPNGPNGQGQWNQQWNASPNPQHPHGVYPPPTSQSAQPYPAAPTNGPYPPAHAYPPPANGSYPPPTSQPPSVPYAHQPHLPHLPPVEPRAEYGRYPYANDMYRGPPPPHMQQYQQAQPAPRQRTAIACRYCRRRKIRCSGFESSEDGRCTNCVRFSQECIFTPVSAQAQAFVPAHTVGRWASGHPQPALYGAYGQPLPQSHVPQPPGPGQHGQPGYPLPSPTGPYPTPGASYNPVGGVYDERASQDANSRKRPHQEPHTPTLPPPNPSVAASRGYADHRAAQPSKSNDHHTYPEPTNLTASAVSPASSQSSYQPGGPPSQQPYYANNPSGQQPPPPPPPQRRLSPQSNYSYDANRTSSSPHASAAPSTPSTTSYPYSNGTAPPQAGRTPPPTSQSGGSRMRIDDLVSSDSKDGETRSTADRSMLDALNRRPM
ncbi:hypothetical protein EJ05DRAFT_210404 [Pseudovirgaria hyperparasitica]|uniref:Zn(2)-C6 fungal-type domain-containing protein n=1 Tax=Pseudovirgaria hyperparasitica TaxID=470096 RepID=A0A6A6VTT3_9PEZI|nr:uncharacterized protein EJ05DRAFT_210404 [Pseudovirgaria hyperparasitica]KAF2753299.1 hypothetical protein EJ05DRAFT_210404 [Pseudovirgaria hyperparasitica]